MTKMCKRSAEDVWIMSLMFGSAYQLLIAPSVRLVMVCKGQAAGSFKTAGCKTLVAVAAF